MIALKNPFRSALSFRGQVILNGPLMYVSVQSTTKRLSRLGPQSRWGAKLLW